MSKLILTGRTELIAAIYNEDFLPTAVVRPAPGAPAPGTVMCFHSLRFGDEKTLKKLVDAAGPSDSDVEQFKFELFPFFEKYPSLDHECIGCKTNAAKEGEVQRHLIKDNEKFSEKLCEDCP